MSKLSGLLALLILLAACGDNLKPNRAPVMPDSTASTHEDVPVPVEIAATDPDGDALGFTVSTPSHGTLTGAAPRLVYTPAAEYSGEDSFTVTASDGKLSTTATVHLVVSAVNDAPVAADDTAATDEDTALTLVAATLADNDADVDGPALTVTAVGEAVHGTVVLAGGAVTFTPDADFNGAASFTYTVSDGTLTDTGAVVVTVNAVNDGPVAVDDTAATDEGTALVIPAAALVGNDTDVDGPALTVTAVGESVNGTVSLTGDTVTFTPAAGFNGEASFTYTVSDGTLTDTGVVAVTVTAVNDAPVAVDDAATTAEDTALTVTSATLLSNDTDVDGPALTVTAVGGAVNGTVVLSGSTITFTPAANFNGAASFTYTVSDGTLTDTGAVAVTVTAVNDAPVAVDDAATTAEDTALTLAASTLLSNDTDVDGPALLVTAVGGAVNGTVSLSGSTITFTPAANFNGAASFTYTVSDGTLTDTGAVAVTVTAVNDAPVAVDDAATTAEDTALTVTSATLLSNDTDVDGPALSVTAAGGAVNGTVVLSGSTITFTPAANFNGAASFTYTVSDGTLTDTGAVAVTVTAVNDAPVAVDDAATTNEDTALTLAASTLLSNDTDVDGPALSVTAVGGAVNGTVSLSGSTITFTPVANFNGAASFTYTVSDGTLTDTGAVAVTVTAVNDAPVAVDDTATTNEDVALVVSAAALLSNDTDVDGPALTVTAVGGAVNGTVVLSGSTITFTPAANFNGAASFTYTVSDGTLTDTGAVVVTVTAVNDAPVAVDDAATTNEDTALTLAASTLLSNDTDVDGPALTVTAVGGAVNGTVSLSGSTITFTPAANFNGAASFTYTVSDGTLTDTGTVAVTVTAVNDGPVAVDDTATTNEDVALVVPASTLLSNDTDVDGPALTVTAVGGAVNGTVALSGSTITFTPDADFNGAASFTYTVSDGTLTDTGAVAVTVTAVNDAPVAVDDTATTDEDVALDISAATLLSNDTDVDGPSLSVTAVGGAVNGSVSLSGTTITFIPDAGFSGAASFTYTVSDGALTDTGTVAVTVIRGNSPPVASNQSVATRKNIPLLIPLSATDADGDPLTYTVVSTPANGTLSGTGANRTYTPNNNYVGTDSFTFRANDGTFDSNDAQIDITVSEPVCGDSVAEPPEACDDGNRTSGDGCRADCRGLEVCGDGFVDSLVGEQCDDGNTTDGDGCSSTCLLDSFSNVPPTVISGSLSCNTNNSNTGRKAAVDELGRFFVAMNCGGTGYVSTSVDRGVTWPGPVSTGITGVQIIAIEGGPTGIAYVAAKTSANTVVFTRTTDAGLTWETPTVLASSITDAEVSMDSLGDAVYVMVRSGTGLLLLRNFSRGEGAFTSVSIAQSNSFHEVIVDKISGDIIAGSDTPAFHVRISSDQGNTFGAESLPPGSAYYSDWAGSNGYLYVAGTNGDNNIDRIPLSAPSTSTQVTGLPSNIGANSYRSIDADAVGNAYVASQLSSGSIQLDRMLFGAATIESTDARTIATGTFPTVAALPSNTGALVAYTSGTVVYGSVVVYP